MKVEKSVCKSTRGVDGIKIDTFIADMASCNTLKVEVGTTGYKGGDSGHGCRTYLRLANISGSDMRVWARNDNFGHGETEIVLGGDTELDTLVACLEFALEKLKEHMGDVIMNDRESRERRFCEYVNDLVLLYATTGKLDGMGKVREKYHVGGITKQQFFECGLHKATGYIPEDFSERVYLYAMGKEKNAPEW